MKFQRRHDNLSPHDAYVRKLIAAENGPEWRATRALFDRTFTTVAVRKYTPILTDLRDIMIQQLEKANKENPDGFDAFPQFHRFTFDTITRLTFGAEVNAMTTKEGAELSHWVGSRVKGLNFCLLLTLLYTFPISVRPLA